MLMQTQLFQEGKMGYLKSLILAAVGVALIAGVGPAGASKENGADKGIAVLHPTQGNSVQGTVTFSPGDEGMMIRVDLSGLTPGGTHGFHIHEYGDCSAPDATSAGGHYDPTDMPHGGPQDEERHVGDLGNLTADQSGRVNEELVDPVISLDGPYSIIGRSVLVHAGEDDFTTQPDGDAGERLACGVVGIAK
jgi:superoxide dismutase, Cu-Zn family